MTIELRIMHLENRLNTLSERNKDNANVIRKIKRQLRNLRAKSLA